MNNTIEVYHAVKMDHFAFERTNHIDIDWGHHQEVIARTDKRRSTSVGDVMVFDNEVYLVAAVGFKFVGRVFA